MPVRLDLPGVGRGWSDHPAVFVPFADTDPPAHPHAPTSQAALNLDCGADPAGDAEVLLFVRPFTPGGDLQLMCALQAPDSRGTISITSPDPGAAPVIRYHYLRTEHDRRRLRHAIRTGAELLRAGLGRRTAPPGDVLGNDRALDGWIAEHLTTAVHLCGSAAIGSVVDESCGCSASAGCGSPTRRCCRSCRTAAPRPPPSPSARRPPRFDIRLAVSRADLDRGLRAQLTAGCVVERADSPVQARPPPCQRPLIRSPSPIRRRPARRVGLHISREPLPRPQRAAVRVPRTSTAIREEHFRPAFDGRHGRAARGDRRDRRRPEPPTFENTLVPLERSGAMLRRVSAVFFTLVGSDSTPGHPGRSRPRSRRGSPRTTTRSRSTPTLFARIDALFDRGASSSWTPSRCGCSSTGTATPSGPAPGSARPSRTGCGR